MGRCVYPSSRFVPGATVDAHEVGFCFYSDEDFGYDEMSGGDFDGDGLTDLVLGSGVANDYKGRVWMLRGWELPWGDPSCW